MSLSKHSGAPVGRTLMNLILLLFIACCGGSTPGPQTKVGGASPGEAPESWQCRNDLEVLCSREGCEAETGDAFTPMSVSFTSTGAMSVCAYTGCWEGSGEAVGSGDFLVLIGHHLEFSTYPDSESAKEDIVIVIDRADGVATLKAGHFAHPLLCVKAA